MFILEFKDGKYVKHTINSKNMPVAGEEVLRKVGEFSKKKTDLWGNIENVIFMHFI